MWAVNNQTRFKADRTFARDANGAEVWLVAVRGTFVFSRSGEPVLAPEQLDVCLAPKYFGEPGRSSLQYDMDLVRTKAGTDIILNAHAYTPQGYPARSVEVGLSVAGIQKSLVVHGNRYWTQFGLMWEPSQAEPFTTLPLTYEHAIGGPLSLEADASRDRENPVGCGRIAIEGEPVPNVEYPNHPVQTPRHQGPPAGFGAVPCDWQSRVRFAGTYDAAWQRDRQPLVPEDFDEAYFRCAPTDQQLSGFLQGGEEVVLHNLSRHGRFSFRLPRVSLGFRTRIDGGSQDHRGSLYTVIIEPEENRLILVWQTSLPCHHTLYTLKETVVFEKERVPLGTLHEAETETVG